MYDSHSLGSPWALPGFLKGTPWAFPGFSCPFPGLSLGPPWPFPWSVEISSLALPGESHNPNPDARACTTVLAVQGFEGMKISVHGARVRDAHAVYGGMSEIV